MAYAWKIWYRLTKFVAEFKTRLEFVYVCVLLKYSNPVCRSCAYTINYGLYDMIQIIDTMLEEGVSFRVRWHQLLKIVLVTSWGRMYDFWRTLRRRKNCLIYECKLPLDSWPWISISRFTGFRKFSWPNDVYKNMYRSWYDRNRRFVLVRVFDLELPISNVGAQRREYEHFAWRLQMLVHLRTRNASFTVRVFSSL